MERSNHDDSTASFIERDKMENVPRIQITEARTLFREGQALFVDTRDPRSIAEASIPGHVPLNDATVEQFLKEQDRGQKIVVYCYHGNGSKMVTAWLQEQGFTDVASLDGGFEAWRESEDSQEMA